MFQYKNQQLFCENVVLDDLAATFGTPLYVYSQAALSEAFSGYKNAFSCLDPLICYAVKANGNLSILRHFASLGSGFDIVSGGELARVLAAGGDAKKTIFSGVGKSVSEIEYALNQDILCFNVESVNELERINTVASSLGKKAPISLRINPDVDAKTHPYISTGLKDNKFGIAFKDALATYKHAASLPALDVLGIDCHIGSQLMDAAPLIEAFERLLSLVDELGQLGIHLKHIDIGGGIGITYSDETAPSLEDYAKALKSRLGNRDLHLMLEPGRSLVGNAGVLLTKVEYIKAGDTKNFIVVDAAMNDLMRPALYQAFHDIVPVKLDADAKTVFADVVGPICESSDFLGKDRSIAVKEGELLAVKSAGAYAFTMASNYNARMRTAEILVNGSEFKLIRERETLNQMLANELVCLE